MAEAKDTKFCPKCKATKSVEDFTRDKNRSDGRYSYCAACARKDRMTLHFRKQFEKRRAAGLCIECGKREAVVVCGRCLFGAPPKRVRKKIVQNIQPFPAEIDRDAFGHWLAGFSDGEACFGVYKIVSKNNRTGEPIYLNGHCTFVIRLRRDETPILLTIQSYFGCGKVYPVHQGKLQGKKKPQAVFCATTPDELVPIIAHFEKYPLRAKKRTDFDIWKQAVSIAITAIRRKRLPRPKLGISRRISPGFNSRWTDAEKDEFFRLHDLLRDNREYTWKDT